MKKIAGLIILLFCAAGSLRAETIGTDLSGNDYLSLTKRERVNVVDAFIRSGKKNGITIKNTPVFYCKKLDRIYLTRPELKEQQFSVILKTLAIMEYDWREKGKDRDKLAREWLGDELYEENRKRFAR